MALKTLEQRIEEAQKLAEYAFKMASMAKRNGRHRDAQGWRRKGAGHRKKAKLLRLELFNFENRDW